MAQEIIQSVPEGAGDIDPDSVSNLTLAYVGDSAFELIIRTLALKEHNAAPNEVNRFAKKYSNAQAQARIADYLTDKISEKELHIYKRGRNAKSVSAPKSCSISEYRRATGLEALCGYLYLSGNFERAKELVICGISALDKETCE